MEAVKLHPSRPRVMRTMAASLRLRLRGRECRHGDQSTHPSANVVSHSVRGWCTIHAYSTYTHFFLQLALPPTAATSTMPPPPPPPRTTEAPEGRRPRCQPGRHVAPCRPPRRCRHPTQPRGETQAKRRSGLAQSESAKPLAAQGDLEEIPENLASSRMRRSWFRRQASQASQKQASLASLPMTPGRRPALQAWLVRGCPRFDLPPSRAHWTPSNAAATTARPPTTTTVVRF